MCHKPVEQRRFDHQKTLHHRKPISIGGARHNKRNHSWIQRIKHQAWHTLFDNHTATTIVFLINQHYIDPDYEVVLVRKEQTCLDLLSQSVGSSSG